MTTYDQLAVEALRRGLYLELDEQSQCYRATCPDGFRFEEGLHEVIAVFGEGLIGNGQSKAAARADLFERLQNDVRTIEPCFDPECDWCNEEAVVYDRID